MDHVPVWGKGQGRGPENTISVLRAAARRPLWPQWRGQGDSGKRRVQRGSGVVGSYKETCSEGQRCGRVLQSLLGFAKNEATGGF